MTSINFIAAEILTLAADAADKTTESPLGLIWAYCERLHDQAIAGEVFAAALDSAANAKADEAYESGDRNLMKLRLTSAACMVAI